MMIRPNMKPKLKSIIRLLTKLEEGEKSAREKGWLSADDVKAILDINNNIEDRLIR